VTTESGRDASRIPSDPEAWTGFGRDAFPGLLGIEVLEVGDGHCRMRFQAARRLQAPHGYLHGGAVAGLADSACGYGCFASLPEGATGFTTIELKANFLSTVREGPVVAEARAVHAGKRTQVWDAVVSDEASGRTIALFRCTQMVLYPDPEA
jgi:uncharacterized protein (TIGR00369 family)